MPRTLSAPVTVAFDYTRSTGPVIGRFLTGLRDGQVVGARTSQGRVVVPPPEFDPVTHDRGDRLRRRGRHRHGHVLELGARAGRAQPLDRPFAFALVTLDGADVPLLHAVDVASPADIETGMRVRVRWAEERVGAITDIACFEPVTEGDGPTLPPPPTRRSR